MVHTQPETRPARSEESAPPVPGRVFSRTGKSCTFIERRGLGHLALRNTGGADPSLRAAVGLLSANADLGACFGDDRGYW